MCNDRRLFVELRNLEKPLEVTLGDGYDLHAIGRGGVVLETKLPSGRTKKCKLHDVLYVPKAVLQFTKCVKDIRCWEN